MTDLGLPPLRELALPPQLRRAPQKGERLGIPSLRELVERQGELPALLDLEPAVEERLISEMGRDRFVRARAAELQYGQMQADFSPGDTDALVAAGMPKRDAQAFGEFFERRAAAYGDRVYQEYLATQDSNILYDTARLAAEMGETLMRRGAAEPMAFLMNMGAEGIDYFLGTELPRVRVNPEGSAGAVVAGGIGKAIETVGGEAPESLTEAGYLRQRANDLARLQESTPGRIGLGASHVVGEVGALTGLLSGKIFAAGTEAASAGLTALKVAETAARHAQSARAGKLIQEIAARSLGFGGLEYVRGAVDPKTGELAEGWERVAHALDSAMLWPAYEVAMLAGGKVAQKLLAGGQVKPEVVTKHAAKVGLAPAAGESEKAFFQRAMDRWRLDGMPGAEIKPSLARWATAQTAAAGVEAVGFSALGLGLEAEVRADIAAKILQGDWSGVGQAVEHFAGTWIGLLALKARGITNIPEYQRTQPSGFTPEPGLPGREPPPAGPGTGLARTGWRSDDGATFNLTGAPKATVTLGPDGSVTISEALAKATGMKAGTRTGEDALAALEELRWRTLADQVAGRKLPGEEVTATGIRVLPEQAPGTGHTLLVRRWDRVYARPFDGTDKDWKPANLRVDSTLAGVPPEQAEYGQMILASAEALRATQPPEVVDALHEAGKLMLDKAATDEVAVANMMALIRSGILARSLSAAGADAGKQRAVLQQFVALGAGVVGPEQAARAMLEAVELPIPKEAGDGERPLREADQEAAGGERPGEEGAAPGRPAEADAAEGRDVARREGDAGAGEQGPAEAVGRARERYEVPARSKMSTEDLRAQLKLREEALKKGKRNKDIITFESGEKAEIGQLRIHRGKVWRLGALEAGIAERQQALRARELRAREAEEISAEIVNEADEGRRPALLTADDTTRAVALEMFRRNDDSADQVFNALVDAGLRDVRRSVVAQAQAKQRRKGPKKKRARVAPKPRTPEERRAKGGVFFPPARKGEDPDLAQVLAEKGGLNRKDVVRLLGGEPKQRLQSGMLPVLRAGDAGMSMGRGQEAAEEAGFDVRQGGLGTQHSGDERVFAELVQRMLSGEAVLPRHAEIGREAMERMEAEEAERRFDPEEVEQARREAEAEDRARREIDDEEGDLDFTFGPETGAVSVKELAKVAADIMRGVKGTKADIQRVVSNVANGIWTGWPGRETRRVASWLRSLGEAGTRIADSLERIEIPGARRAANSMEDARNLVRGMDVEKRRFLAQIVNRRPRAKERIARWKAVLADKNASAGQVEAANRYFDSEAYRVDQAVQKASAEDVAAAEMLRGILDRDMLDLQSRGFMRVLPDGTKVLIGGIGEAFPQRLNKAGMEAMKGRGRTTPLTDMAQKMVDEGEARDLEEALVELQKLRVNPNRGVYGYFERTRTMLPIEYVEWDPLVVLPSHLTDSGLFVEATREWGNDFERLQSQMQMLRETEGVEPGEADLVEEYVEGQFRVRNRGVPRKDSAFWGTLNAWSTFTKLGFQPFSMLRNAGQVAVNTVRWDIRDLARAYAELPPIISRYHDAYAKLRSELRRTGAILGETEFTEAEAGFLTTVGRWGIRGFRNVEVGNQMRAAIIARLGLERDMNRLLSQHAEHPLTRTVKAIVTGGNASIEATKRRVKRLTKLSDEELADKIRTGQRLTEKEIQDAMFRMVRDTQFPLTLTSKPHRWDRSPMLRAIGKFKNFAFRQSGWIGRDVLGEAAKSNFGPLMKFVAVGIVFNELYHVLSDIALGREKSITMAAARGRSLEADELATRIGTHVFEGGGVMLADLMYGISDWVFGPLFSTLADARRSALDAWFRPEMAPEAFLDFIEKDVSVVSKGKRMGNLLFGDEDNEFSTHMKWRSRGFEMLSKKERERRGVMGDVLSSVLEGGRSFPREPESLTYELAAEYVMQGDVDDAANILAGLLRGKEPAEMRKAITGIKDSMSSRSPLGSVAKKDWGRFLDRFSKEEQVEALNLQQTYMLRYQRALAEAFRMARQ